STATALPVSSTKSAYSVHDRGPVRMRATNAAVSLDVLIVRRYRAEQTFEQQSHGCKSVYGGEVLPPALDVAAAQLQLRALLERVGERLDLEQRSDRDRCAVAATATVAAVAAITTVQPSSIRSSNRHRGRARRDGADQAVNRTQPHGAGPCGGRKIRAAGLA